MSKRRKKRPIPCPAAENGALVLFYTLLLTVAHQLFQLIEEALDVRELLIDRGKADIGHLVDFLQFLHGQLTDAYTRHLAVIGARCLQP